VQRTPCGSQWEHSAGSQIRNSLKSFCVEQLTLLHSLENALWLDPGSKKKKKVYKRHVLETTRDIVVSAASYMISRMSFNVGAHKTEDPLGFRSCEL